MRNCFNCNVIMKQKTVQVYIKIVRHRALAIAISYHSKGVETSPELFSVKFTIVIAVIT